MNQAELEHVFVLYQVKRANIEDFKHLFDQKTGLKASLEFTVHPLIGLKNGKKVFIEKFLDIRILSNR